MWPRERKTHKVTKKTVSDDSTQVTSYSEQRNEGNGESAFFFLST